MAYLCFHPKKDATIILLNNEGWYDEGLSEINATLSAILFHKPYEIMQIHTEIKLSDFILKKYVGEYAFDKKHHAFVTLVNHNLQIAVPAGNLPKSPLFAENENNFWLKIIDARIEFIKDSSGNITELVLHYFGKNEISKRVK